MKEKSDDKFVEEGIQSNAIAIIIYCDNELYYTESLKYVSELDVPEEFVVDVLCVGDSANIASAYNEAMLSSNAKFKVYLKQGVLLLNKRILYDIIDIFSNNRDIGMLGVAGNKELNQTDDTSEVFQVGGSIIFDGNRARKDENVNDQFYTDVLTINDALIATQYDIPWKEDSDCFYNVSQSLEMKKAGLRVVVPYQQRAWSYYCIDYGLNESEQLSNTVIKLFENHDYEKLLEMWDGLRATGLNNANIYELLNLVEIYRLEEESVNRIHSEWFELNMWDDVLEYVHWLRFVLIRMLYEREDERIDEVKGLIRDRRISFDAIRKIACGCVGDKTDWDYLSLYERTGENPLISVIVPVYNGEKYIQRTIDSVLEQTYKNIELIVVDDCSGDRSRQIIDKYTDSRIKKIYLEKNRHICYSGNVGFENARGKYIALIGHDDKWMPDKIEKQVAFMEEHPEFAVCFTWVDIVNEFGVKCNDKYSSLYGVFCTENYSQNYWNRRLFYGGNSFCAPSACIRTDRLSEVGFYKFGLVQLQDYELWMRLVTRWPIYILQEKLVEYSRFEVGENLSTINADTLNRDCHEKQWIKEQYIRRLEPKHFLVYFNSSLRNRQASGDKEIWIEKAFLLWSIGNCFAEKWFLEILEDKECREILETKYSFTLKDFYKMNTAAMHFDMDARRAAEQWEIRYKKLISNR